MSAHTPGPWEAVETRGEGSNAHAFGIIATRQPIAAAMNDIAAVWERGGKAKTNANARLIAAAPELLEALRGVVAFWDAITMEDAVNDLHVKARAAIAKATGDTA